MAVLYITEYAELARDSLGNVMPVGLAPALATQKVDFTSGETKSAAFQDATTLVRLVSDTSGFLLFGASPTATSTEDTLLVALAAEYFGVQPRTIAALKVSIVQ